MFRLINPFPYITLKNGQTYFKNLAVLTPQDFLKYVWPFFSIIHERVITTDFEGKKKGNAMRKNIKMLQDGLTFIEKQCKTLKLIRFSAADLSNSRITDEKLLCDQIRQFLIICQILPKEPLKVGKN